MNGHHPINFTKLPLWRCDATSSYGPCGLLAVSGTKPVSCPLGVAHDCWTKVLPPELDASLSASADVSAPSSSTEPIVVAPVASAPLATRQRLPPERGGPTRKFRLKYVHQDGRPDEMKLYFTANTYLDGRVGEVLIKADRMGTLARGALDATAIMISLLLQHGVLLSVVTQKLRHTRYGPDGFTGDPEFPSCSSPLDLLAQWLDRRFGASP